MMRQQTRRAVAILAVTLAAAGCGPRSAPPSGDDPVAGDATAVPQELTVLTHDSFSISDGALAAFEGASGVKVRFLEGGDTGTLVNKAVLTKGNPNADVLYGVDNTFLSRALDEGIFERYESPQLSSIPDAFQMDPEHRALPVDYGDVCPNYDASWFTEHAVRPPASLEDLTLPALKGLAVVENPATSSPGLAFLLATIARFGDPGYLDYWAELKANDVRITNDWETAYNSAYTRMGGDRPIVVSYASSPLYEVLFADAELDAPPSAAVIADEACFRQVEFVGILAGTKNRAAAEAWVDFMLDRRFQEDVALQMFVLPVRTDAELAPEFKTHLVVPTSTARVSPQEIAANREKWIAAWTEAVLR